MSVRHKYIMSVAIAAGLALTGVSGWVLWESRTGAQTSHTQPATIASSNPGRNAVQAASRDAPVVLAAGDVANCNSAKRKDKAGVSGGADDTARLIQKFPDTPLLALGDLAYSSGTTAEFRNCYDRYWGMFKSRTFPVPGNHEYRTPKAAGYFDYWGDRASSRRDGYYSFDVGQWHIVALNSEIDGSSGSEQGRWLDADLSVRSNKCILAYFHRPAFSAMRRKGNDDAKRLFKILYRHRVSVVLSGHNHFYERTLQLDPEGHVARDRGIRSFIVGTGGQHLKGKVKPADFTEALVTDDWGVLHLELLPNGYRWEFLREDDRGEADSGSDECIDRGSDS